MDTGGYDVGGFEIWRLWVPPDIYIIVSLSSAQAAQPSTRMRNHVQRYSYGVIYRKCGRRISIPMSDALRPVTQESK